MAKITELLPAYLEFRVNTQHRAANTIKNDRESIRLMVRTVGDIDPRHLRPAHLDKLVMVLGSAPSTYNTRLSALRTFMLWCRRRGHVGRDFDPMAELINRKNAKPDRHRVPVTQFFHLLDQAQHPRDRVMVALGLWMFLRALEVRQLRVKDLDLENGELHVFIQKTDEYDIMPISAQMDREFRRWLTFYTEKVAGVACGHEECGPLCGEWFLVPARQSAVYFQKEPDAKLVPDRMMYRSTPHRSVQIMLEAIGFRTDTEGMHTLRRSGARAYFDSLVDGGFDGALKRVSSMLHHASVTMTERYLGIREDRHTRNRDIKASVMFPGIESPSAVVLSLSDTRSSAV